MPALHQKICLWIIAIGLLIMPLIIVYGQVERQYINAEQ